MRNYHFILLSTLLFVALFYHQDLGLNFGILGVVYAVFTLINTHKDRRNTTFLLLFSTSIMSSLAFAWYGDFPSFFAVVVSILLLGYRSKSTELSLLWYPFLFLYNGVTFFYRFFSFSKWLPVQNTSDFIKKLAAFIIIPLLLMAVFIGVYSLGSDQFASLFGWVSINQNLWEIVVLSCLGFFLSFNYFEFSLPEFITQYNSFFDVNFNTKNKLNGNKKQGFSLEIWSGISSFFLLNIVLTCFIFIFSNETFSSEVKLAYELSGELHEHIAAVIFSIVLAIILVLFYFKSYLNFDEKAKWIPIFGKIWLLLNAVLLLSAFSKNFEYILGFGYTYKRLGVVCFLLLALAGIVVSYVKIENKKPNSYLFSTMIWFFYGAILSTSYFNWGGFITAQNEKRASFSKELTKYQYEVSFNEKELLDYANKTNNLPLKKEILYRITSEKKKKTLSKILYYQRFP